MNGSLFVIAGTAATIGLVHTLIGPDHYLPFIVISRARGWKLPKTLFISFLCGLGHVGSSIILGFLGVALGVTVFKLKSIEAARGNVAAWALVAFGFVYFLWGLRRALRNKPHTHVHVHADGERHVHVHGHLSAHTHVHADGAKVNITPWILFTIFVFGPCEPLIPLVMYPAAKHNMNGVLIVSAAFSLTTILTMLVIIGLAAWGVSFIRLGRLERYVHALAGAMICLSGLSVQLLGL